MKRRDDLLVGPKEKAIEAIKAGKTEEALKYLEQACEQYRALHNSLVDSKNNLLARLFEAKGPEWYESFERSVWHATKDRRAPLKNMSAEEIVKSFIAPHRSHYSEFHIEEDDEKFVLKITNCNAGGRMLRDGVAAKQDALTKEPYSWSANEVGFPYYCDHIYFVNEVFKEMGIKAEIRWGRQFDDQGKPTGGCCEYIAYK
jgi:hypothetical protein